ncbi:preprotein translocase subunit SecY [Bradyrhizobium sp. AUGA SZCCT0182]|uniref:preprotein translocase subunit SecY n=1 Tax=Bradyrhizobium sp. AUGA SZCCT0182 TaxID=2807667 RepID=UPI001BA92316|nr:preprotein translocase subunit SecY [Bradyrhizobium sp. AUGA SZCCT0182]MBR1233759.1 preprotein translocase subunit SecY [Bradyrhizobium sp. AUGA SZCCT0182]
MKSELPRRIAITIGALLIFRLGSHVPLAGLLPQMQAGLLLSSGAAARISIFALFIIPYLSVAIVMQLVAVVWGRLSALERSGEAGRRKIARFTLILTLLLAAFQAFGVASSLQDVPGLVTEPGAWFLLSATATMVGGVFFLVWLSEQITRYGIGNGLALILFVGIIVSLPADISAAFQLLGQGAISGSVLLLLAILAVVGIAVIVLVEGARRNVPVQYAARQAGTRLLPARSSVLPIKINSAGFLIPATVTPWIFYLPLVLATLAFGQTPTLAAAYDHIQFARPVHMILGSIAVFVLAFIYTAYVLDPARIAEVLHKRGGAITDVAPGEPTADHLDRVVTLTTFIGAVYLVAVSLIPEALVAYGELPFLFGGGSALIVVCTILDIKTQVRGHSLTKPGGELS